MPANPESPRGRFVEAMRGLYEYVHSPRYFAPEGYFSRGDNLLDQACEAFADAEFDKCTHTRTPMETTCPECRRDLLRECGLEDADE